MFPGPIPTYLLKPYVMTTEILTETKYVPPPVIHHAKKKLTRIIQVHCQVRIQKIFVRIINWQPLLILLLMMSMVSIMKTKKC